MRVKAQFLWVIVAGLPIAALLGIRLEMGLPIWPQMLMLTLGAGGLVIGALVEKGRLSRAVFWPIGGAMVFGGGIGLIATVVAKSS